MAWTALKALDRGANTLAPTATPMTAIAAITATGKTMPKRRIRPRLRRLLRAPVRCRDKAILSSGHARVRPAADLMKAPALRLRARGTRPRADPRHLNWCAVWPTSRKYRWRSRMPERPPWRAPLRQENQWRVYRNGCDADHRTITLFVTNADQAVIPRPLACVISVSRLAQRRHGGRFRGAPRGRTIRHQSNASARLRYSNSSVLSNHRSTSYCASSRLPEACTRLATALPVVVATTLD